MPVSNSNYVLIKKAIHDKLVSELVPGGKIAGVKRVGTEWLDQAKVYPYVYVGRPQSFRQTRFSAYTYKRVDAFLIGVACRSTTSLEDAQAQLDLLMDDGIGKGILAILNDPANFAWGGLAQESTVTEGQSFDNLAANKTAAATEFVAYDVIRYEVTQKLTVQAPAG